MTPQPLKRTASGAEFKDEMCSPKLPEKSITRDSSIIVIELSASKRIVMSSGVVTLYDSLGATDVSTSRAESKILALEALLYLSRLEGRNDLDPSRERPIANRIIMTFPSKSDCIKAIDSCVSVSENRRVIMDWTNDVWVEDEQASPPEDEGSEGDSTGGSLFST
jgi:hypothetical protein